MAQLTIDTEKDSTSVLDAACKFLMELCGIRSVDTPLADDEWAEAGGQELGPIEDLQDVLADEPTGENGSEATNKLAATDARLDPNNVPFNPAFCGEAQVPFYASGKCKGQWKKKKGITQPDYDAWYAGARPASTHTETGDTKQVNSAEAFGHKQDGSMFDAPTTCGLLMEWISVKQTAKLLLQTDIDGAWGMAGLTGVVDLIPPKTPDVIARNVALMYEILSAKAGA